MLRKLLPLLLALAGLAAGAGGGLFLRPPPPEAEHAAEQAPPADPEVAPEYVKLNNQFVVPIMQSGRVVSMVILSLGLEVEPGNSEAAYSREPRLRDAFLQVLFDHANAGGFQGSFTDSANLVILRRALLESATSVLGGVVRDVLISDIARQDS